MFKQKMFFLEGLRGCIKTRYKTFDLTNLSTDLTNVSLNISNYAGLIEEFDSDDFDMGDTSSTNDATVTLCHSATGINNIREYCKNADIIISAAGCPNLIDDSFELNDQQIIIDVGCNLVNSKLCGDVHFERVAEKVGAITPVPGGVGPMTRAAILTQIMIKE